MAITALFGFWGYWCPYLQLGGLLGYLGFSTFSLPFPRPVQLLGLHYEQFLHPCQVWPHIQPWGSLISFSLASIPDYLTGGYLDDQDWDTEGLAARSCGQVGLYWRPWAA